MTHNLLDYPGKMHAGGYRVTPQRKAILDAICEAGRRVTVEEITLRLRKKSPTLNRATIYRNLLFLQRMHLVNGAGDGKDKRFEIASVEPHHHLICRECGRETGLDRTRVERLKRAIQKESRFTIDDDHLCFFGICRRCASGANRKSQASAKQRTGWKPRRKHASS
ncbi:MAG: transcriptional repressor [Anaerolineales bacterium]|nr:transcriptional repressor [Anaerolineales bacterium]